MYNVLRVRTRDGYILDEWNGLDCEEVWSLLFSRRDNHETATHFNLTDTRDGRSFNVMLGKS